MQALLPGMIQPSTKPFSSPFTRMLGLAILVLTLLIPLPARGADEVVTVVNKGTHVNLPMSRYELSSIFGMRQTSWPDGSMIRVYVLADDDQLNALFCKQILRVFPHQLRQAWDRLVYSGTGQAPVVLSSPKEMATRIANTPGAVGYLPKDVKDDNIAILPVE